MFQIFLICIFFLNLHTMSLLQIGDICKTILAKNTLFVDNNFRHFVEVTYSTNQENSPLTYTLVVYIDMYCRHLQTLFHISMNTFHILVDNFIIMKKTTFQGPVFCQQLFFIDTQIACCLRKHYSRSLQTILQTLLQY